MTKLRLVHSVKLSFLLWRSCEEILKGSVSNSVILLIAPCADVGLFVCKTNSLYVVYQCFVLIFLRKGTCGNAENYLKYKQLPSSVENLKWPETHIKRQATRHDYLSGWLGNRNKWSEEKIFCTGLIRAAKAGKTPFHMYSMNSHLPQVPQSAGPPLSGNDWPELCAICSSFL